MNIFVTGASPAECALALDDLRFNKMIVETAQILSTVARKIISDEVLLQGLYKPTHQNHPCVLWAHGAQNNLWLRQYLKESLLIFKERKNKQHACFAVFETLEKVLPPFKNVSLSERDFVNCSAFKSLPTFEAYRKTLEQKWANDKRKPTWNGSLSFAGW